MGGDLGGALGQFVVADVLGDDALLVAGRAGAGPGGDHDRVPLAVEHGFERFHVVAGDLRRVFEVTGVGVHLPAADLALGEHDFVPEALEECDGGLRGLREHDIRKTRGEEGDAHRVSFLGGAWCRQHMRGSEVPPRLCRGISA